MSATDRAMMLGIRHRCGQHVQFWIPAYLIEHMIVDLDPGEILGLAGWMSQEGMLTEDGERPPDLIEHLREQLAPRDVAFIDVERDPSVCPSCGSLLPWIEAVSEYMAGRSRGEY